MGKKYTDEGTVQNLANLGKRSEITLKIFKTVATPVSFKVKNSIGLVKN